MSQVNVIPHLKSKLRYKRIFGMIKKNKPKDGEFKVMSQADVP